MPWKLCLNFASKFGAMLYGGYYYAWGTCTEGQLLLHNHYAHFKISKKPAFHWLISLLLCMLIFYCFVRMGSSSSTRTQFYSYVCYELASVWHRSNFIFRTLRSHSRPQRWLHQQSYSFQHYTVRWRHVVALSGYFNVYFCG